MFIIMSCIIGQFLLLAYLNTRACSAISRCSYAAPSIKKTAHYIVWCIPILGILLVANRVIPNFYRPLSGANYYGDGGGYSGGD
jgi:hypothetical protein